VRTLGGYGRWHIGVVTDLRVAALVRASARIVQAKGGWEWSSGCSHPRRDRFVRRRSRQPEALRNPRRPRARRYRRVSGGPRRCSWRPEPTTTGPGCGRHRSSERAGPQPHSRLVSGRRAFPNGCLTARFGKPGSGRASRRFVALHHDARLEPRHVREPERRLFRAGRSPLTQEGPRKTRALCSTRNGAACYAETSSPVFCTTTSPTVIFGAFGSTSSSFCSRTQLVATRVDSSACSAVS